MKKTFWTCLLGVLLTLCCGTTGFAVSGAYQADHWEHDDGLDYGFFKEEVPLPGGFFQLYLVKNSFAAGIKPRLWQRIYGTGNLEYREDDRDLLFQVGAVYTYPYEMVFLKINGQKILYLDFYFYGGGGVQFSRNQGYHYPYLILGLHSLFLFAETVYPRAEEKPVLRTGLSFKL